ncbi:Alpha/beta hydrolase family-domain-containing protein [Fomitopsis serialis]|uniref:Alpha/beta hydrolase family-domain-containing protein n=1 Tax=Fomitopsis serialis TaxID=139415 RepID=UPI002007823E|nr:Alpha/beta hydrolase family-domain-containing protein [Neoantrodia serialis]KAH9926154.1 Alpha/beta hydrolase family-domain-containing protein [Neoantrodia serialis]
MPLPVAPPPSMDKKERDAAAFETANALVAMRYTQWNGELTAPNSTRPLSVCLNRYVRREAIENVANKGTTLLLVAANGFPKEIWEPVISHLIQAQRQANISSQNLVDEIWAWEAVNHGDAALVNEQNLSSIFDCQDNARDLLQFLLHYLPEHSSLPALPTHLPRVPDHISQYRRSHGFQERVLVGVGHSLGGCSIARAAVDVPVLFSSLILIEPAIVPYPRTGSAVDERAFPYIVNALKRSSRWPSREAARKAFRASSFFQTWDPQVFDNYVEHALCTGPEDSFGVKLKTPPIQEALGYSDVLSMYETWDLMDELDERIELRFVVSGKEGKREDGIREMTVWRRPVNSSNVVFPDAGHLIVQETPRELGQEIRTFLQCKYGPAGPRL